MDRYELDIYGYVSPTNFKYVLFKVEPKLNRARNLDQDKVIKPIFDQV